MNYIDIVIGVILILALINGIRKGLIYELASLAGLVLGVLGAIKFSGLVEEWLLQYWDFEYIGVIAFIITFAGIVVLVQIVAKAIEKVIEAVALGSLNRIGGGLFSIIKVAFILSILISVINIADKNMKVIPDEQKASSRLYEPISIFAPMIFPYLKFDTEEIKEKVEQGIHI